MHRKGTVSGSSYPLTAKSRRCYHRVISGIERGGELRFLTLTSGPDSPPDIQRSFRALYMRLKRRGLIEGYIKVPEYTRKGRQHLHVLFRGQYIAQVTLSRWWNDIHRAPVVDIRKVYYHHSPRKVASYMAKYMSKERAGRYSWNWTWVWRGFCRDWQRLKRLFNLRYHLGLPWPDANLILWWRWWLKGLWQPDFSLLPEPP